MRIDIHTLGALEISIDGQPAGPLPAKAQALLVYLAITSRAHSRSALAGLLWGEMPEERARANLRLALTALRSRLGDILRTNRSEVGIAPGIEVICDANRLAALVERGEPEMAEARAALAAYRGEFLAGFESGDALEFEEWMRAERERLNQAGMSLGLWLAGQLIEHGELPEARTVLLRCLEITPWSEETHRRLIEVYAALGERSLALAQYERCRKMLEAEFGVEPDATTQALYARLRETPDAAPSPAPRPRESVPSPRGPRLPAPPTPLTSFIGRETELAQLGNLLRPGGARLVTLLGPGGSGKTRLALAALERYGERFPNGAAFTSFTGAAPNRPGEAEDLLVNGIAATLGYAFEAQQPPHELLAGYLSNKALLLVLDNLETLVAGSSLLLWLLERAPGLAVLTTSRERLGAAGEQVVTLGGLAYPAPGDATDPLSYPACRLFAERAHDVQPGLDIERDRDAIARICRSVDGHPLAIELAATWARALDVDEIAARITHDQDLLSSDAPGIADRHRSIRVVCEQTYELLSEESRRALARLSVFRGGWELDAAQAVAGCGLPELGALVDRSLVRRDARGRFDLHELVRQFAAEMLAEDAVEQERRRGAHADYFTSYLAGKRAALDAIPDPEALAQVDRETDNLRAAWEYLIERQDSERAATLIEGYWPFLSNRGRYQEAVATLLQALELPDISLLQRVRWRRQIAQALYQMGDLNEAEEQLDIALGLLGYRVASGNANWPRLLSAAARQTVHRKLPSRAPARSMEERQLAAEGARALYILGQTAFMHGDAVGSLRAAIQALNFAERAAVEENMALNYAIVALTVSGVPAPRIARHYCRLALAALERNPSTPERARAVEALAVYAIANGDWEFAGPFAKEAEALFERLQHRRYRDESTGLRALVAYWGGDLPLAARLWTECALSAEHRGDLMAICWGRAGLVEVELRRGRRSAESLLAELERIHHPERLPVGEVVRLHGARSRCLLLAGDATGALAEARRGLACVAGVKRPISYSLPGYELLQDTLIELDRAGAAAVDGELAEIVDRIGNFARIHPIAGPAYHYGRGYRSRRAGRASAARQAWQESLSRAERLQMPYEQARAHLALATLATDEGRAEHLRAARALYQRVGAQSPPPREPVASAS